MAQARRGAHRPRTLETVLLVAMPDAPERRARLAEVAEAYKRLFAQDSVVTLLTPSCVSF